MSYVSDYFASHGWSRPSSGSPHSGPTAPSPTPPPSPSPIVSSPPDAASIAAPDAPASAGTEATSASASITSGQAGGTAAPIASADPDQPVAPTALVPLTYHHAAAAGLATPTVSLLQLMSSGKAGTTSAVSSTPITAEMIAQANGVASRARTAPANDSYETGIDSDAITIVPLGGVAPTARTRAEVIAQAAYKVVARVGDMQADVLTLLKA